MAEKLTDITLFRRREGRRFRYWGHAIYAGTQYTFWCTDRKIGWIFKDFLSYSGGYSKIEDKVAEQSRKGYVAQPLTAYRRSQIAGLFVFAVIANRMHTGKKRR